MLAEYVLKSIWLIFFKGHVEFDKSKNTFAVSSAPYGSAGILPITFMYIKMMGKDLIKSTQLSILNVNYIASRLLKKYKILYTGKKEK